MELNAKCYDAVLQGLQKASNKAVPFWLLYDSEGSELYKKITELESYYPFHAEKALLKSHANDIPSQISPGSIIVELGCGSAEKTPAILKTIRQIHDRCHYVGIDVSSTALRDAAFLLQQEDGVQLDTIEADYIEGLCDVRKRYRDAPLCVLWLGSSVGNLSRSESVDFLKKVLEISGTKCQLLLCTDMWKDESRLRECYVDMEGVTDSFIKNGMKHALAVLGRKTTEEERKAWLYEVDINPELRQVEMYVRFPQGLSIDEHHVGIRPGERVQVEISRKFTNDDVLQLASESGFVVSATWGPIKVYASYFMISSVEALLRCWRDTDDMFKDLIPNWSARPIAYRHPFCFYYGHTVSFAKIKMLSDEPLSGLDYAFSRGIDPSVLDPSKCHSHPEVPTQWPEDDVLVEYVRERRATILDYIKGNIPGNLQAMRLLHLGLEHERMHQETLWYMVIQNRKLNFTGNGVSRSETGNGGATVDLKRRPELCATPDVAVDGGAVVLGRDPMKGIFLWDNEQPYYSTTVDAFYLSSSAVSIGEYMAFVVAGGYDKRELWMSEDWLVLSRTQQRYPATWSLLQGEYFVHRPEGSMHWWQVFHKPVFVSLMEAEAFCKWRGCRVMTEAEYQRAVDRDPEGRTISDLKTSGWEWTSSPFQPFPGFVPMEEYPEYSTDFFDGHHYVLKGSSPVTHSSFRRDSFRNFYQRHYPYVFAKFRCCCSSFE